MNNLELKAKIINASLCSVDGNNAPLINSDTILFRVKTFPEKIRFFLKIVFATKINAKPFTIKTAINHINDNPTEDEYQPLGSGSMILVFNDLVTTSDLLIGLVGDQPIEYTAKKQGLYKIKVDLLQNNDNDVLSIIDSKEFNVIIAENIVKMG